MKIHEYQAKRVLTEHGVPIPKGEVTDDPVQARKIAEGLGFPVIIKAQIHAGGRGKGGGVKLAKNAEEAERFATEIIGMNLVTHQTGPEGRKVKNILVEEGMDIERELYLGMVIDRGSSAPVIMASQAGGMEIEQVAADTPKKILTEATLPGLGLQPYQARRLAYGLGLEGKLSGKAVKFMQALHNAFIKNDCSLAEINPLVVTTGGDLLALDAKMDFDDNALFRHKDMLELRDLDEEDPLEVDASEFDLNYITLDGNIGCMVNGAGLAMATMDIIKLAGGEPANFLDVGGGTNADRVASAFRILMSDKNVKAVLINIFGGIVRCDRVAEGVVGAMKQVKVDVPVIVRLEGTNAKEGGEILRTSGFDFQVGDGLKDASEKAVAAAT